MKYELILKNEKTKYYKAIRDLIAVFNLIGFIYQVNKTNDTFDKTFFIIFSALTSIYIVIVIYERFFKTIISYTSHRTLFLWSAVGWSRSPYWWFSLILIAFLFLDILAHRKLILTVTKEIINYPSFPVKQIEWASLSNLILKDGLVTIDFKNNKIIQQPILNSDIDEKEFNDYCKLKISPKESFGQIENCPQYSKSKL